MNNKGIEYKDPAALCGETDNMTSLIKQELEVDYYCLQDPYSRSRGRNYYASKSVEDADLLTSIDPEYEVQFVFKGIEVRDCSDDLFFRTFCQDDFKYFNKKCVAKRPHAHFFSAFVEGMDALESLGVLDAYFSSGLVTKQALAMYLLEIHKKTPVEIPHFRSWFRKRSMIRGDCGGFIRFLNFSTKFFRCFVKDFGKYDLFTKLLRGKYPVVKMQGEDDDVFLDDIPEGDDKPFFTKAYAFFHKGSVFFEHTVKQFDDDMEMAKKKFDLREKAVAEASSFVTDVVKDLSQNPEAKRSMVDMVVQTIQQAVADWKSAIQEVWTRMKEWVCSTFNITCDVLRDFFGNLFTSATFNYLCNEVKVFGTEVEKAWYQFIGVIYPSSVYNEDYQVIMNTFEVRDTVLQGGVLKDLGSKVVMLLASLAFTDGGKHDVGTWTRRFQFSREGTTFLQLCIEGITEIADYVLVNYFDVDPKFGHGQTLKLTYTKLIDDFVKLSKIPNFEVVVPASATKSSHVRELHTRFLDNARVFAQADLSEISVSERNIFMSAWSTVRIWFSLINKGAANASRITPTMVWLFGRRGQGKSEAVKVFPSFVHDLVCSKYQLLNKDRVLKGLSEVDVPACYSREYLPSDTFSKPVSSAYWEGYNNNWHTARDEVMPVECHISRGLEVVELMAMIGTGSLPLDMAELSLKGKVYFNSSLVTATTNFVDFLNSGATDPAALQRRIHFPVRVQMRNPGYTGTPEDMRDIDKWWYFIPEDPATGISRDRMSYGCKGAFQDCVNSGKALTFTQLAHMVAEDIFLKEVAPRALESAAGVKWRDIPVSSVLEPVEVIVDDIVPVTKRVEFSAPKRRDKYAQVKRTFFGKIQSNQSEGTVDDDFDATVLQGFAEISPDHLGEQVKLFRETKVDYEESLQAMYMAWDHLLGDVNPLSVANNFIRMMVLYLYGADKEAELYLTEGVGSDLWFWICEVGAKLMSKISSVTRYNELWPLFELLGFPDKQSRCPRHALLVALVQDNMEHDCDLTLFSMFEHPYLYVHAEITSCYWARFRKSIVVEVERKWNALDDDIKDWIKAVAIFVGGIAVISSIVAICVGCLPISDEAKVVAIEHLQGGNGDNQSVDISREAEKDDRGRKVVLGRYNGSKTFYLQSEHEAEFKVSSITNDDPPQIQDGFGNWYDCPSRLLPGVRKNAVCYSCRKNGHHAKGCPNKRSSSVPRAGLRDDITVLQGGLDVKSMSSIATGICMFTFVFAGGLVKACYGLAIGGTTFVTVWHCSGAWGDPVSVGLGSVNSGGEYGVVYFAPNSFVLRRLRDTDLCVVTLGKNCPDQRKLFHRFASRSDIAAAGQCFLVRSEPGKNDSVVVTVAGALGTTQMLMKEVFSLLPNSTIPYKFQECVVVGDSPTTKAGDCGYIWVKVMRDKTVILGLHCCAMGQEAGVAPLFVEDSRDIVGNVLQGGLEINPFMVNMFADEQVFFCTRGTHPIARLDKASFCPNETELEPTPFLILEGVGKVMGPAFECDLMPAALASFVNADGEHVDVWDKAHKKMYDRCTPVWPSSVFSYFSDLKKLTKGLCTAPYPNSSSCRRLTLEEACFGGDLCDSLNDSSSVGYIWKQLGYKSRKQMWCVETKFISDDLRLMLDARIGAARKSISWLDPYEDMLKDELRDSARVRDGKTRIYNSGPPDAVLHAKMVTGHFVEFIKRHPVKSTVKIGLNVHNFSWKVLFAMLVRYGNLIGADFSNYDSSIPWLMATLMAEWMNGFYRYKIGSPECNELFVVCRSVCAVMHISGRTCYRFMGGNASGNYLTGLFNCFVNHVMHALAYEYMKPEGYLPLFEDRVSIGFYGDDNAGSVHDEIKSWYNMLTLCKFFGALGFTYTTPDKGVVEEPFLRRDQFTFLARSFVEMDGLMLCPLKIDSVLGRLCYTRRPPKDMTRKQLLEMNIGDVGYDLYHHGEKVFDYYYKLVSERANIAGISMDEWRSFEYYDGRFKSNYYNNDFAHFYGNDVV